MSSLRPRVGSPLASAAQLLLPVLVVVAWLPGISAPYQYDDYNTPVGDPASQSLSGFWQAMPQTLRPLTKLSYALESSLGAVDAPSRRLFNAVVFGVCIVLVRELVRRVGASPLVALAVAVFWGLHPVHAETILALAGRPVLVCLCLTLSSAVLLLFRRPWWALACAVAAVAARESGLPWLLVCTALSASQLGLSRRKLALSVAAAAALGFAALLSVATLQHLVFSSLGAPGAVNRLGLQWAALFRGTVGLFAFPASFTLDMDFAPSGLARLTQILGALGLYAGALWLAFGRRRVAGAALIDGDRVLPNRVLPNRVLPNRVLPNRVLPNRALPDRAVRIAALLWLCLVIPTHSVIPKVDPFTARPFSASSAPLLVLVTYGAVACFERFVAGTTATKRGAHATRWALTGGACLTLVGLVHATQSRAALYQDPVALWRDAAERSEHKTRPLINLGTLLAKRGELHGAERALEAALERDPSSLETRGRLGAVRRLRALNQTPVAHPIRP